MATRTINQQTGELVQDCPTCEQLTTELDVAKAKLKGAERDLNAWRVRYEDLRRDKEAEAREHELWDQILDLFDLWRRAAAEAEGRSKPKRNRFTADRFWMALPLLKAHGLEMAQRAIVGRCWDHFDKAKRKNGSTIHYCEWERIFEAEKRFSGQFEESANRAPKDWRQRLERLMT